MTASVDETPPPQGQPPAPPVDPRSFLKRTDLIVDLTAVGFMDSTGLGVLVGALKKVRTLGGDLRLVINQEKILQVFRITALTQVFTIHSSIDEALHN